MSAPTFCKFSIPGTPVPKGRGRIVTNPKTGRGMMTSDKKTVAFEQAVRLFAAVAMDGKPPILAPVALYVDFFLPVPGSWSGKRKREAYDAHILPTSKPDLSNILKSIEDGMNEIVYRDDAQICCLTVAKRYAEHPSTVVHVTTLHGRSKP